MDVSVVVPFHNTGAYIDACLRAILSQDYPTDHYEIIMVDNNSTDGSGEIVRRYARVKYLTEPLQGSYAARNRGVTAASGAIVAFTDPDCAPGPEWLGEIAAAMRTPDVQIVMGRRTFANDVGVLGALAAYEAELAALAFTRDDEDVYFGYTNNMAVRRAVFAGVGPFVEIMRGADNLFVRRVVTMHGCSAVRYVPSMEVRHLEITGVRDYCRKKVTYGRVSWDTRAFGWAKPLSVTERVRLVRRAARGISTLDAVRLFLAWGWGAVCFAWGRWVAIWHTRKRRSPGA